MAGISRISLSLSLFPSVPIIHCSQLVFQTTTSVRTELLYVSSLWSANTGSSMYRVPLKNITYEFVLSSPAVSCMPCSSYLTFEIGGRWPYSCCFIGAASRICTI